MTLETRRAAQRERRNQRKLHRQNSAAIGAVQPLVNKLPLREVLDEEGIQKIHKASMRLLSETGMLIIDYPSKVWIDEDTLMHFISQAPEQFTQLARNPENNLPIGGNNIVFAPIYGPPFAADLDRGRREATLDDFQELAKLVAMIPHLHHKAFMGSVVFADNARDSVTLAEILFGKDKIQEHPALLSVFNASSPLRFDDRMLSSMEVYAQAKQAVVITPFIIAGAMSPSTMAATIAQLKSMARSWQTSICVVARPVLAHQRIVWPSMPVHRWPATISCPIVLAATTPPHAFPTPKPPMNQPIPCCHEKLIMDVETLGMLARYVKGISLTDEDFAWDAYEENGPGQHFLGTAHTMRHYETAFYQHNVFNMDNYEKWEAEGSEDTRKKANGVWKKLLNKGIKNE